MPAHPWELAEALEEGVVFHPDLGPARIETAGGKVSGVAFHPRIAGTGQTRQTAPRFDESQTTILAADTIIVAIGQAIDSEGLGVATGSSGRISADKGTLATNIPGIFAGGDAVLGPASIADAMGQGHIAAQAIDAYLRGGKLAQAPRPTAQAEPARNPKPGAPREDRVPMAQVDLATRQRAFTEINQGYTAEQAIAEARRCLACGLCSECMECVKACSAGRHLPRSAGRGTRDRRGQRDSHARFRGVPGVAAGRVRPRALCQRAFERPVRADALGGGSDGRPRSGGLRMAAR